MTTVDFSALRAVLADWDGRRRREELLRRVPLGLAAGLSVALAAALLSRVIPLMTRAEAALFALAAGFVALSATGLLMLLRPRPLIAQAHYADRQLGLRERMTAAVEIEAGLLVVDQHLSARQLRDALGEAAKVDASALIPLRPRAMEWLPALTALALLALVIWLPNPQEAVLLEQRAVAEAVAQQAEAVSELAAEIAADDTLTAGQREALLQPLEEALAALQQPGLSREEAVAALSGAETELRALSRELDSPSLNEALAAAGTALDGGGAMGEAADALQAGQPGRAAESLNTLADSLDQLDANERAALANQLATAAAQLEAEDPALADSLNRAAEALDAGDIEAAQNALGETAAALNEIEQSGAAAAQATGAADQLGSARSEVAQSGAGQPGGTEGESESATGSGQEGSGSTGSAASGGEQQAGGGAPSEGGGHVESVFVPQSTELEGQGEDLELEVRCLSDPELCGPLAGQSPSGQTGQPGGSRVPYDRVFGQYRDAAIEALGEGTIPPGMESIIRDYFSALEP